MQFSSATVRFFLFLIVLASAGTSYTQDRSLQYQFDSLKSQSETYTIYKVIKTEELDGLWKITMDSLKTSKSLSAKLSAENADLKNSISLKEGTENELRRDLAKSQNQNDTISIFGADLQKTVYHFMVWGIIIGLIVGLLIVFGLFQRSNVVTVKTARDYESIVTELESFREESREKQAKLKRELQTMVNKLEETKRSKKGTLSSN